MSTKPCGLCGCDIVMQPADGVRVPEDAFESWYNRVFRTRHADTRHMNDCEEAWNAALLAAKEPR